MKRIKPADFIAALLFAAVILGFSLRVYSSAAAAGQVRIDTDSGSYLFPLDEARTVRVEGPLGTTTVSIERGGAAIVESPCSDGLCINMGRLEQPGEWAACLPNRIFLSVQGGSRDEADIISY